MSWFASACRHLSGLECRDDRPDRRYPVPHDPARPNLSPYRFVAGSGQTAEGRSCEEWLDSSGVYGTWAIEGNAIPTQDQWTERGAPVRLSVSYCCDGPVADGEAVVFDLGLYVLDDGGRARMARWSASDVPVRSQSVRLAR